MKQNSTMDPDSPTDKHNSHVDEKRVQTKDVSLDETNLRHVDVDNILHFLGSTGRYQKVQFILLMILCFGTLFPILNTIFIGKFVNFRCAETSGTESSTNASWLSPNQTRKLLDCRVEFKDNVTSRVIGQEACETYQYDGGDQFVSYLAEWDLVCDKEVLGQLPQILLIVGEGLGSGLIPPLGDRFGRRRVVIGVVLVEFLLMLVSAFVQHFEVFLILRLLIGACIQGGCIPVNSMMVEIARTKSRPRVAVLLTCSWLLVLLINGIAGYLLKDSDWRMLQLTYALIGGVPCIVAIFFLDESLRWLVGNSRVRESEAILRKACRWNSRDYHALREAMTSDMKSLAEKPKELKADKEETDVVERCKPLDVLKNKNARKITLVMCFTWLISSLTYYAIFLMSTSLAGDPYINYFLVAVIDMPAGFMSFYVLKRLDRKPSIIGFQLVSATAMFMAVLVANVAPSANAFKILQTCLTLFGQFFVSTISGMLWMYTPELFPINLRNFGVGVASTSARVGSSCSPLFTLLARKVPWMPGALFGGGCLVSAFLLTTLPETRGVPLPVTLGDVDNMSKKKKGESPTVPATDTDTGRGHDDNCLRHEEKV